MTAALHLLGPELSLQWVKKVLLLRFDGEPPSLSPAKGTFSIIACARIYTRQMNHLEIGGSTYRTLLSLMAGLKLLSLVIGSPVDYNALLDPLSQILACKTASFGPCCFNTRQSKYKGNEYFIEPDAFSSAALSTSNMEGPSIEVRRQSVNFLFCLSCGRS